MCVAQTEEFVIKAEEHKVYKLSKVLYGLLQAPRVWNIRLAKSLKSLNFMTAQNNKHCIQETMGLKHSSLVCTLMT